MPETTNIKVKEKILGVKIDRYSRSFMGTGVGCLWVYPRGLILLLLPKSARL